MSRTALDNLVRIGKLAEEAPATMELEGLKRAGRARLDDAENTSLHLESRFDLAYNAAHSLSLAALRWYGYRSDNRYLVFQCLQHTVQLAPEDWRVLSEAHRKRNMAEYEGQLDVEEALVEAVIRVARRVDALLTALGPATSPVDG